MYRNFCDIYPVYHTGSRLPTLHTALLPGYAVYYIAGYLHVFRIISDKNPENGYFIEKIPMYP
jgi:hypothetical protein